MNNIVIIGSGWYGLHIALLLQEKYNVTIIEKNSEILNNSSFFNQNRLHLGYHYPRSNKTRIMCLNNYDRFIKMYRPVIDFIDKNYYCISKDSLIDYTTFLKIYESPKYNHTIINNTFLKNIEGDFINTQEKIINSNKVKSFFTEKLKCNKIFNYNVTSLKQENSKVIINNDIVCDFVFDCTFNQLQLSNKKYIYELTISFIYERTNFNKMFDSITIMDGNFFSLFPRDINKQQYSVTHVKYTPLIKTYNYNEICNYKITNRTVNKINKLMVNDIEKYYTDFKSDFKYISYFTSYKCKIISSNDNRDCIIEKNNNIISVNCGKITGIFDLEDYIKENFII
jgi:hypothetical protein